MTEPFTLDQLQIGESALIQGVLHSTPMKHRLLDFGLQKGCTIQCISHAPSGSPITFLLHGVFVAIRTDDCKAIFVSKK